VHVTSQKGGGTTFEVWLPILEESWDEIEPEEVGPLDLDYPKHEPPSHHFESAVASHVENQELAPLSHEIPSSAHSGYVLVVEDEIAILQALEVMLLARGYQAKLARDVEEALLVLDSRRTICAAVVDIMLSGRSGVELFHELRAKDPDLPIVFISGYNESEALIPLVKSGEVQYLRKPFSSTQLMEALELAYQNKRPQLR
jgi:CheY-like chemotaxis protein